MNDSHNRTHYSDVGFAIDSKYHIVKVLGKGTYGIVCSATIENHASSNRIAIKKVMRIFSNEILVKRAVRELRLMRQFRGHKNIITLIDLDFIEESPYDGLYCYQELMDYDLSKVIQGPIQLTDLHVQSFTYQLLCGVKYIHSANVIHRDLKPGNILVNSMGHLKICDFGLARGVNEDMKIDGGKITKYVATRWYRAPELMLSHNPYGKPIDMWSVGCIICEIIGRRPIFKGRDHLSQLTAITQVLGTPNRELIQSIGSSYAWEFFSAARFSRIGFNVLYPKANLEAIDLIENLLTFDSWQRLTAEQALSHEYLKGFHHYEDEPCCETRFDYSFEKMNTNALKLELRREVQDFRRQVRAEAELVPLSRFRPSRTPYPEESMADQGAKMSSGRA